MKHYIFFLFSVLLFLHCAKTLCLSPARSPVATPPKAPVLPTPPASHADTIKILLKAGRFLSFVRLIKAAQVDTQLFSQLNSSSDGITMFAPNDNAFSSLRAGAVDSLSDPEKAELVQFHILPRYLSTSDFQTLSNPVKTLAGSDSRFPLTITTTDNSVKINSGVTKTSISNTIYTDKEVAIYEVDKVLAPKGIFPPAPAPTPKMPVDESPVVPKDASDAVVVVLRHVVLFGIVMAGAILI